MSSRWDIEVRKRADKDHQHKKDIKKQKQHLYCIKTKRQLKEIRLNSKRG